VHRCSRWSLARPDRPLRSWAQSLPVEPVLRGIVILSPHWMSRKPAVMSTAHPQTWHDFGGFPAALYALQYPAPGSPALAKEVLGLLQTAGIDAVADDKRPLDHGAWVPLMHLFPDASVPVVQVALPIGWGPADVYAMGVALQGLRESGVLLVGSGSMTHNLGEFLGGAQAVTPYVTEFSRWIEAMIQNGDIAALLQYRELGTPCPASAPQRRPLPAAVLCFGCGRYQCTSAIPEP
jgi:4,5-DOPA dioxygenase extradiol